MKQTKQTILFSLVLAVMMLVGANTAFGQLTAIKTDGTTLERTACATADWAAAQTFIDNGGTIRMDDAACAMATDFTFTKSVTITTDLVTPTVSVLTIAATTGVDVGTAATSTAILNPDVTVTLGPRVQIVLGGAVHNSGVLVLSPATASMSPAKIVMTNNASSATATNANRIVVNARGTLTNNGTIETGAYGSVNPTAVSTVNAPTGVYMNGGTLGTFSNTVSAFGNIFFLSAYTVPDAATTFRIASGRGVGIGADFTLEEARTTTFSRAETSGTGISVNHYAGIIAGDENATLSIPNGTYTSSGTATWTGNASDKLSVGGNTSIDYAGASSTGPLGGMVIAGNLSVASGSVAASYTGAVSVGGNLSSTDANFRPALTMTGGTSSTPATITAGTYTSLTIAANAVVATAASATTITGNINNRGSFVNNSSALSTTNFNNYNVGNAASTGALPRGNVSFTNNPAGVLAVASTFRNTRIYLPASGTLAISANAASVHNYGSLTTDYLLNEGGAVTNYQPSGTPTTSGQLVVTEDAANAFVNSAGFFDIDLTTAAPAVNTSASLTNYGDFRVNGGSSSSWVNTASIVNDASGTFTFNDGTTKSLSMLFRAGLNEVARIPVINGAPATATGSFTNEGTLNGETFTNHGTFTNQGNAFFSTSFFNTVVEKTATNTNAIATTSTVENSKKITTPTFTNTGGTVTNSDTLLVSLQLNNTFAALTAAGTRNVGVITNETTGVVVAQRTTTLGARRAIKNLGTFTNNGIVRTDSLMVLGSAASTPFPAVTAAFTNAGTVVAHKLETSLGNYSNSGTTTISVGNNCTAGCAPGNNKTSGAVSNAGTITNTAGMMTLPGLTSSTSSATFSGDGTVSVSGGELTFGTGAMTFTGTLNVSGGTATISGATTNSGTMAVSATGSLTVDGALTNNSTLDREAGTFTVVGTLTNGPAGLITGLGYSLTPTSSGLLASALRAAQGTGYLANVLDAAATDGIIVRGNFTNNATTTYTGNIIVSNPATGAAVTRTIAGTGVFGTLTLAADITIFGASTTVLNVERLFLNGLLAVSATTEGTLTTDKIVNLVGGNRLQLTNATEYVNGLSESGVFAGAAGRWSDKVTVKHNGANYASFGQTTATLANGPLEVTDATGFLQLVGNAFVKSAVLTGKVNRPTIFTFTTVDAMDAATLARVITVNLNGTAVSMANIQLIHNVAGLTVNVSVDDVVYATNLTYQSATPYVQVPANAAASVVVTAGTTVLTFDPQNIEANKNYILIFQGGDNGKDIEMNVVSNARTVSTVTGAMQFIFNHGVTNGPAVTVERVSTSTPRTLEQLIAVNATYGSVTQYLNQTAPSYSTLRLKAGGSVVGQYLFDFTGNEGQAVTLLATGTVGGAGSNALMIIAVDAAGDVVRPAVTTSDDNDSDVAAEIPAEFTLNGNFPNPFNPTTNISFDLPEQANVRIEIIDLLGRQVMAIAPQSMSAGANKIITVDAARLSSGVYFYRLIAEGSTKTFVQGSKFTLVK